MQRFRSRTLIVFLFALLLVLMAGRFARAQSNDPKVWPVFEKVPKEPIGTTVRLHSPVAPY